VSDLKDEADGEDHIEFAKPVGKVTKRLDGLRFYNSVQVPWNVEQWDPSLRLDKDNHRYWSFHVGDVVAIATSAAKEPLSKLADPNHNNKKGNNNPWYPYSTPWSPAFVLAIYHEPDSSMEEESSKVCSSYCMAIQWFQRWGDIEAITQRHLQRQDSDVVEQLKSLPRVVVETEMLDNFPATAVLGKLNMVAVKNIENDESAVVVDPAIMQPDMPPSVVLQCGHRLLAPTQKGHRTCTDAEGWDEYYCPPTGKGKFEFLPWKRANDNDDVETHPLQAYANFFKRNWQQQQQQQQQQVRQGGARGSSRSMIQPSSLSTPTGSTKRAIRATPRKTLTFVHRLLESELTPVTASKRQKTATEHTEGDPGADGKDGGDDGTDVASTIVPEERIRLLVPPIHQDKSSGRVYYDKIAIEPPYSDYAIRHSKEPDTELCSRSRQRAKIPRGNYWELKLGDVVVAKFENTKTSGPAYFEPNTVDYPIKSRENPPQYPFHAPWGGKFSNDSCDLSVCFARHLVDL